MTVHMRCASLNDVMERERYQQPQQQQPQRDKPTTQPQQLRAGRSGEGARSVIPHLKADQRARAVARIGKRQDRDF